MSLSIGIVGLPNVGKSTLFNALTKKEVLVANYPFATIDPSVGIVAVPDIRREKLAELSGSKKDVPAIVEFVDIAGLVKGAHAGEGLGNKFLLHIRQVDAICFVLRAFADENIINTQESVDPLRDKDILSLELGLKDLEFVLKRIDHAEKEAKSGKKEAVKELAVLKKAKDILEDESPLADNEWEDDERKILKMHQLLTLKPRIYILNIDKKRIEEGILKGLKNEGFVMAMNIKEETEAVGLSQKEKEDLGVTSHLDTLIGNAYKTLGLVSFFTTGEKETRAWTTKEGSTAPVAAGVIHTDFREKFIRAEVIFWEKLVGAGSWSAARAKGIIKTEGKDYVVQDGDVIEVRHGA